MCPLIQIFMKEVVKFVVNINAVGRLVKFRINKHSFLDVLDKPLKAMYRYRQSGLSNYEAGGLLVGYVNDKTGNYTISEITTPGENDIRNRTSFVRKDENHIQVLEKKKSRGGYIGTWHTHPHKQPVPSVVDIIDWKECMTFNNSATRYLIFLIMGTEFLSVWVGDCQSKQICELQECEKHNGIYII